MRLSDLSNEELNLFSGHVDNEIVEVESLESNRLGK
jgi:hypothetical protein